METSNSISLTDKYVNGDDFGEIEEKSLFFISTIEKILDNKKLDLLDIGCNDGALLYEFLKKFKSSLNYSGLDISEQAIKNGIKMYGSTGIKLLQGDAFELSQFKDNSLDIITCSTFLHELGSYNCEGMKQNSMEEYNDGLKKGLKKIINKLNIGGHLIILDPLKVQKGDFVYILEGNINNAIGKDGFTDIEAIRIDNITDITKLSYITKFILFLKSYKFAKPGVDYSIENGKIYIKKWLLAETIWHVPFSDTMSHFKDELNEKYGSLNIKELQKLSIELGFSIEKYDEIPCSENDYDISEFSKNFVFFDKDGNELSTLNEFPTHYYTILRKS